MRRGEDSFERGEEGMVSRLLDASFKEVGGLEEDGGSQSREEASYEVESGCYNTQSMSQLSRIGIGRTNRSRTALSLLESHQTLPPQHLELGM